MRARKADVMRVNLWMKSRSERMLRVFAAMTGQKRPGVLDTVLRCGLADAARRRGGAFHAAFRAVCRAKGCVPPAPDGAEVPADLPDGSGETRFDADVSREANIAVHAFAELADCTLGQAADEAACLRVPYLASLQGEGFYEAWAQATAHAMEAA